MTGQNTERIAFETRVVSALVSAGIPAHEVKRGLYVIWFEYAGMVITIDRKAGPSRIKGYMHRRPRFKHEDEALDMTCPLENPDDDPYFVKDFVYRNFDFEIEYQNPGSAIAEVLGMAKEVGCTLWPRPKECD